MHQLVWIRHSQKCNGIINSMNLDALPVIPYAFTPGMCRHQSFVQVPRDRLPSLQLRIKSALLVNDVDHVQDKENKLVCAAYGESPADFAHFVIELFKLPPLQDVKKGGEDIVVHIALRSGRSREGAWGMVHKALYDYFTCSDAELATQVCYKALIRRHAARQQEFSASPFSPRSFAGAASPTPQENAAFVRHLFFKLNTPGDRVEGLEDLVQLFKAAHSSGEKPVEQATRERALLLECLVRGDAEDVAGVYAPTPVERIGDAALALPQLTEAAQVAVDSDASTVSLRSDRQVPATPLPLLRSVLDVLLYSCLPHAAMLQSLRDSGGVRDYAEGGKSIHAQRQRQLAAAALTSIAYLGDHVDTEEILASNAAGQPIRLVTRQTRARLAAGLACMVDQIVTDLPNDLENAVSLSVETLGSLETLRVVSATLVRAAETAQKLRASSLYALKRFPSLAGDSTWLQSAFTLPPRCPALLYPRTHLPPLHPEDALLGFLAHAKHTGSHIKSLVLPIQGRFDAASQLAAAAGFISML